MLVRERCFSSLLSPWFTPVEIHPPDAEAVVVPTVDGGSLEVFISTSGGALTANKSAGDTLIRYESLVKIEGLLDGYGCATHAVVNGAVLEIEDQKFLVYEVVKGPMEVHIEVFCDSYKVADQIFPIDGPLTWKAKDLHVEAPEELFAGESFVPICVGLSVDDIEIPIDSDGVTLTVQGPVLMDELAPGHVTALTQGEVRVECRLDDLVATQTIPVGPGRPVATSALIAGTSTTSATVKAGTRVDIDCVGFDQFGDESDWTLMTPLVHGPMRGVSRGRDWVELTTAGIYEVTCSSLGVSRASQAELALTVVPSDVVNYAVSRSMPSSALRQNEPVASNA